MSQTVTGDDLVWWLARAAELEWIFAQTYASTAPHSYVVLGRSPGLSRVDYVRAGRVIRTFGRPAKFYGSTNLYLTSPDGQLKWWTMDPDVRDTTLVNQATTDRVYGVQNAPSTESGIETAYDAVASAYDELHPATPAFAATVTEAVDALRGDYPPAVLDVGCGTGRVLDLEVTTPDRYAGVDPSTPMLNHLVLKHPGVGAVYPMRIETALERGLFTAGQFEIVTAILDPRDAVAPGALDVLASIASRGSVVAWGRDVEVLTA